MEQQAFLKAYKTSETKGFFPYEGFDCPQKMNNSEIPPYNAIFSKLRNVDSLEKGYSDSQKILKCGLKTEESLSKMKPFKPLPSGEENYKYLPDIRNHENMCTFKDFLRWYSNKHVVPTIESMQKMLCFYHKKGIDMLKQGCTFPNLASIFSTNLPVSNSIHFLKPIRTCCEIFEKILLVVLLSSSHVKL